MAQDQPGVDEIVASQRDRIGADVVTGHLEMPQLRGGMNRGSMSVASTLPVGPTRSASHRAILPPPAPISQHAHPAVTPTPVR